MKIKIVTYNVNGKIRAVNEILKQYQKDDAVIIMQEFPKNYKFNTKYSQRYIRPKSFDAKCTFLHTASVPLTPECDNATAENESNRFSVYALNFTRIDGQIQKYRIIGIHGFDQRNFQIASFLRIAKDLELFSVIRKYVEDNSIVVGDFNADPYSRELSSVFGLMTRFDDQELYKEKNSLINPMWKFLSDKEIGTYFFHSKETERTWRILDQVMYGKDIEKFCSPQIRILTELNGASLAAPKDDLLKSKIPNKAISDHFPVELTVAIGGK